MYRNTSYQLIHFLSYFTLVTSLDDNKISHKDLRVHKLKCNKYNSQNENNNLYHVNKIKNNNSSSEKFNPNTTQSAGAVESTDISSND